MTLGFFSNHPDKDPKADKGRRRANIETVRIWMKGRTHLPKDLVAALHALIPELKEHRHDDWG